MMARLQGIQALRGVAAVAVILYHVARHLDRVRASPVLMALFQPGHAGVDLFFVLSGFIILHVHGRDIGRPGRLGHYCRQRATRVLPLYWIALMVTVALPWLAGHAPPDPAALLRSASLLPFAEPPLLGIAWTLRYELLFYALFALLILWRPLGLAAFVLWAAAILLLPADPAHAPVAAQLRDVFNIHFFLGMAVALLARRRIPAPRAVAVAGALLLVATGIAEGLGAIDGYAPVARLLYGPAAALLVLGLVAWERDRGLRVPAALLLLGEASYSLYLFQFVWIGLGWRALTASGLAAALPVAVVFALLSIGAVAGGLVTAARVERPLLARFRPRAPRISLP